MVSVDALTGSLELAEGRLPSRASTDQGRPVNSCRQRHGPSCGVVDPSNVEEAKRLVDEALAPRPGGVMRRPTAAPHGRGGVPRRLHGAWRPAGSRSGCSWVLVLATSFIRDGCGLPTPPFGSRGGARPTPGRPRCACRALRGQAAAAGSGSAARSPGAVAPR